MTDQAIKLPEKLWQETIMGLRLRSRGSREAACIWAGNRTSAVQHVEEIFFLDDLPGVQGHTLRHNVPRNAINLLFSILKEKGYQIIADVHTHPNSWVGLSEVDMEHPIEYRIGLPMIVIPNYGKGVINYKNIGVHVYQGKGRWKIIKSDEVEKLIIEGDI